MVATYRGVSYKVIPPAVGSYRTGQVLVWRGVPYAKRQTYV